MQGEPAEILQLQVSKTQTGSLRFNHRVFLAAYGGDRVFVISQANREVVYSKSLRLHSAGVACANAQGINLHCTPTIGS